MACILSKIVTEDTWNALPKFLDIVTWLHIKIIHVALCAVFLTNTTNIVTAIRTPPILVPLIPIFQG